jgi:Resolvase, N terminal domain
MSVVTRVAAYARVSTERQAETQTIDQQVEQLLAYAGQQGWPLRPEQIYRDDGYSGARLDRPALDRLRDAVSGGAVDTVLVVSPDRLARRYAYQVWLLEEFERAGCPVVFLERPPTGDPRRFGSSTRPTTSLRSMPSAAPCCCDAAPSTRKATSTPQCAGRGACRARTAAKACRAWRPGRAAPGPGRPHAPSGAPPGSAARAAASPRRRRR